MVWMASRLSVVGLRDLDRITSEFTVSEPRGYSEALVHEVPLLLFGLL